MAKGIYKRSSIYWIRYAGLNGKTVYESSCSKKFTDAEEMLIDRKKAIKEGKQPGFKKIAVHVFKDLAPEYLKWAERQRSFRTKKGFVSQLVEVFGNLPLRRFSTKLIEQYQTDRINKGNKPATVNRLLATIKHMFTKAVEWDMVEEEVFKGIRRVKLLEENNRRLRYLSKDECIKLLNSCDPHLRPIVLTAMNTGMRKGEILSLKWDNVDLVHGFILLDITKNGERREIPINDTLKGTLRGIIRRIDVPNVFINKSGRAYNDIKKSFATACRRAGIHDFRFHDLRHTFASHLVMSGIDITTVKDLLGHKSLTMTLRYTHLAPSHRVQAVERLDRSINGEPTIQKLYNTANLQEKEVSQC